MILVDSPRWPAHGTTFGHLVSDDSLAELHEFARAAALPIRGFDHDHYDVPARLVPALVEQGALPVESTELLRRLAVSGLRVRNRDRTPRRRTVPPRLREAWARVLPGQPALGEELIGRWSEEHRHYHDVRHLWQLLHALGVLGGAERPAALAGWFHDAVYLGQADDVEASAELASDKLAHLVGRREAAEVARLVRVTQTHEPDPDDRQGAILADADLSILGTPLGRYQVYARDVRLDYAHVPDPLFAAGRLVVLESLLARDRLFHTSQGRRLWQDAADTNVDAEASELRKGRPLFGLDAERPQG